MHLFPCLVSHATVTLAKQIPVLLTMNFQPLEQRRVKITTEVSSSGNAKLQHLAASHPFTRQARFRYQRKLGGY